MSGGGGQEQVDFFISYTETDVTWAEWIAWVLEEEADYTTIVQQWDMVPGSNWPSRMDYATKTARHTIAVVSPQYLDESVFGRAEWLAAYRNDPEGLARRLIPVRVAECTIGGLLGGVVHIDLVGVDEAQAPQTLLDAVSAALRGRNKPHGRPGFPRPVSSVPSADTPGLLMTRPSSRASLRPMIDRIPDRQRLEHCFDGESRGVAILRGHPGIGKTLLVEHVMHDVRADVRVHHYEVSPDRRLDLKTLSEFLEPTAGTTVRPASLVRVQQSLAAGAAQPVVIVVDSAQNLMRPGTTQLADAELDSALELIAANTAHRATVLLVTQKGLQASRHHRWPDRSEQIELRRLPFDYFMTYLENRDEDAALGLSRLSHEQRQNLYACLEGNPRLAELFCVVVDAVDVDPASYYDRPWLGGSGSMHHELIRQLLENDEARRDVLRAFAAVGTAVEADVIARLVPRKHREKAQRTTEWLSRKRVLSHLGETDQYVLPADDAGLVLDQMREGAGEDTTDALLRLAAAELSNLLTETPLKLVDLRYHFARLAALLRAKQFARAYTVIEQIDRVLDGWNSRYLLFDQRLKVSTRLGDLHSEMSNDNALADLHRSQGDFPEAITHFRAARQAAVDLGDEHSRLKVSGNLAWLAWRLGETSDAHAQFTVVLEEARECESLMAWVSALDGLSACHRRHGQFENAIANAQEALAVTGRADFPHDRQGQRLAASIAVNLAQWYAERHQPELAAHMVKRVRDVCERRADGSLEATWLNIAADVRLYAGDLEEAEDLAGRAVQEALEIQDASIVLQARTTLAVIHLERGDPGAAKDEIQRALPHRRPQRSLVVLAVSALTLLKWERTTAREQFGELLDEAEDRLRVDPDDYGARGQRLLARCALRLDADDSTADLEDEARQVWQGAQPAAGLRARLASLLGHLAALARDPERFVPVIEALG